MALEDQAAVTLDLDRLSPLLLSQHPVAQGGTHLVPSEILAPCYPVGPGRSGPYPTRCPPQSPIGENCSSSLLDGTPRTFDDARDAALAYDGDLDRDLRHRLHVRVEGQEPCENTRGLNHGYTHTHTALIQTDKWQGI